MNKIDKIALGTVQFGLKYGVSNHNGKVDPKQIREILVHAIDEGIDLIDTAIGYGDSELQLGRIGVSKWRVTTKLPNLSKEISDVVDWVHKETLASLERLRISKLYGLLLHRPINLIEQRGDLLYQSLLQVKKAGLVDKIGVSIYDFKELKSIIDRYEIDLIQAPFNLIDRRLIDFGVLDDLKARGVEVHVRSVFLQGLLLMPSNARPFYFSKWQSLWDRWESWLNENQVSPTEACLRYALSIEGIDRVVVGVDNLGHLKDIMSSVGLAPPEKHEHLRCNDMGLINPTLWKL